MIVQSLHGNAATNVNTDDSVIVQNKVYEIVSRLPVGAPTVARGWKEQLVVRNPKSKHLYICLRRADGSTQEKIGPSFGKDDGSFKP